MKKPAAHLALLLPLLALSLACGTPADDDGRDGGGDGGTNHTPCADLTPPTENLALDTLGPLTQIHAAAAFANQEIWVAYSHPSEGGNFSIQALRLSCDGAPIGEPWAVSADDTINQLDPAIVGSGERVLVAWQSDNQTAPYNLDTHFRLYDAEGAALTGPTELAARRGGVVNEQNAWMPQIAPRAQGGFTLVGAWGHADATAFQAYGQHLDADASLVGESWDWDLRPAIGQVNPTVSLDGARTLQVAWDDGGGSTGVTTSSLAEGAGAPAAATPIGGSAGGTHPSLASHGSETWLAYAGMNQPRLRLPGGLLINLGDPGTDHSPVVAADETGAMVAWYRNLGGLSNEVHFVRVASDGTLSGAGEVGTTNAAPYPLSLIALGGGRFFLTWQDGANPDFVIRGRFLTP
ncbi:MAG: hypothetical protein P1V51_07015 [Deltaproteobacteria bacterium]|nr:hypothetical protein [Deltaproteobacteria bacterium]